MKLLAFALCSFAMFFAGCSSSSISKPIWDKHPAELRVSAEISFSYKPIMGWWNRAPSGVYSFVDEDADFVYFRLFQNKVSYGSRFDKAKYADGGVALRKSTGSFYVYIEEDYEQAMHGAGELAKSFLKPGSENKLRTPFGEVPLSERQKIQW